MKYLAFYDVIENKKENRNIVLSATNKISYILNALDELDVPCDVISASGTLNKKSAKKKTVNLSKNSTLTLPFSLGKKNALIRFLDRIQIKIGILFKLLKLKKDDCLMVYHSLYYMKLVRLAKKLKGFKLILEVEEIYGDVTDDKKTSKKELDYFKIADAYIFSNDILNEKINQNNKPYSVLYGTYNVEKTIGEKFSDGKIHLVYAGTFDINKGGAITAVSAGEYLNSDYHIHIIGFGTEEDKRTLLHKINEVSEKTDCTITYDGLLSGEDYIKFLQRCHIGLSTQSPNATFNDTSFPSKILSYMANGLNVLSIRIPAIEKSQINEFMHYYDTPTSCDISKAIKSVNVGLCHDSREIIKNLDLSFKNGFNKLLGEVI